MVTIDNLKGGSMICWEYQTRVIINTDCIPSRQIGLRFKTTCFASESTMDKFNPISHLQPFKNITPRRTVILEPPTITSAASSGISIDPLVPSSFPQSFSRRTNDTVGRPRGRQMWRFNQKCNLFHRRRQFRNVC